MINDDPRRIRLSKHFVLSDFLGNHSVYSKGYRNPFELSETSDTKIGNATALCQYGLEPLLEQFGAMSVSYGYISPELSTRIVKYQDPAKPSHHRWDLGAAADVCVHNWVAGNFRRAWECCLPESAVGSPVALAHYIDQSEVPYSRILTYSESPYLCIALSERELLADSPRKAFYENRYQGKKGDKPEYLQLSNQAARNRHFSQLQDLGLEHPWQGAGYPTYHGGGFQQYQHMRVSAYTMVSDWLFDLKSISEGHKNVPCLHMDSVQDAFAAAGIVYDWLMDRLEIARASIIEGYVSHLNPGFIPSLDWRKNNIRFTLMLPEGMDVMAVRASLYDDNQFTHAVEYGTDNGALSVNLEVDAVLKV